MYLINVSANNPRHPVRKSHMRFLSQYNFREYDEIDVSFAFSIEFNGLSLLRISISVDLKCLVFRFDSIKIW